MGSNQTPMVSGHLPLSHMTYVDNEIDIDKAKRLVVYHYHLVKSFKWKEWQNQLDDQLSDKFYPYLMKGYQGQFGLFIAVDKESETPPRILNGDGIEVTPERVYYAPEHNPIWIRLIMRKVRAFGTHCLGSHTLGRPVLKVDSWQGKLGGGVTATSLDCRTQLLKDKSATEVVLFHENLPLREVRDLHTLSGWEASLWVYRDKQILMRWFPEHGKKPTGAVYREIPKNKNRRVQRAFIDVGSKRGFEKSWPWILKPVQEEFIKEAATFGFDLKPKVLNLKPLPLKTKYKSNPTKSSFASLDLGKAIQVIDLRISKTVTGEHIVAHLQSLLDSKQLGAKLQLLPSINAENLATEEFDTDQRLLVLLDQKPNIVDDRYPLTITLRTKVACQHINVNPHDLSSDSVEDNLLVQSEDEATGKERLMLQTDSPYFDYQLEQYDIKENRSALLRNVEIAVKELELKSLMLNPGSTISNALPDEAGFLNERLVVITDGYLFTVRSDRPVLLPFDPSDPQKVARCDAVLGAVGLSVAALLALLQDKWPYNYRPEVVMQGFGSPAEKLTRFARRLTFVIEKSDVVSVMFQDPKYETPHVLPIGLSEARDVLHKQAISYKLREWVLPGKDLLAQSIAELTEEGALTSSQAEKLSKALENLLRLWNETLKEMVLNDTESCLYSDVKKRVFKKWLDNKNAALPKEQHSKTADTNLIGLWDDLLSRVLELPLKDIKGWLRNVPGISRLWYDDEQHYFVVGGLMSPKPKITRQPSIRQWHSLQGQFSPELIAALVDVDWVRVNQLAGNPCVATLVRRWRECQSEPDQALGLELIGK
ncbi:MAG: hypothetical protein AAGE59_13855 [Cyanobacteria bacterium P01_F01_bin.86]